MIQARNAIMEGHVDPTLDPTYANALLITWDNTVKKVKRPIITFTTFTKYKLDMLMNKIINITLSYFFRYERCFRQNSGSI